MHHHSESWAVYIDGSALPNPGRMSIGGIAYAPDGSSHRFHQALPGAGCNNEAEARAATPCNGCSNWARAGYCCTPTTASLPSN